MIKNPIHLFFRWWYVRIKPGFWSKSYLKTSGFLSSNLRRIPMDGMRNPIPWMNYSFIDFLTPRLSKDLRVFEYGSGHSTLYFSNHTKQVTSIEHDKYWLEQMREQLKTVNNAELVEKSLSNGYVDSIAQFNATYDIVIVDGQFRNECLRMSIDQLSPQGVIILDDSSRSDYLKSFELANEKGFKELTIAGLKPVSFERHQATIFYRPENCLGI